MPDPSRAPIETGAIRSLRAEEMEMALFPPEFLIFPNVPLCDIGTLRALINEVGLGHSTKIETALDLLEIGFGDSLREDGSPVLEGHVYLVTQLGILYSLATGGEVDERLVLDGLLHDYVEDSKQSRALSLAVVEMTAGAEVARDVMTVTNLDYRDFAGESVAEQKDARNREQAALLANADDRIIKIKGCDRFVNWCSMHVHPTPDKYIEYLRKSGPLLDLLGEREPLLAKAIHRVIAQVHDYKSAQDPRE